ncbi:sn-glycerol-3-phosphate ABC transporter ATP-binding protein UgpC [soil metagenome]
MAAVTFGGVTKRFDQVIAVDRLDLAVRDGEFMVLLGPSGCGKTTALRMVAGLEEVTDGELRIGDRVVNDVEPRRRDIAMVFQSYALYPHLSVAKNIESPLLVREYHADGDDQPARKLARPERRERVTEAARMLGLDPYLERKPAALSGGQRQRVALARAIVARPLAFLMDEPLSNLDAKLRAATRAELVGLHRWLGTTIIYVTHDQVEAMTMADRIAVMADGRLQQVGTPQEIYERPHNLFVAQFIGTPPSNTSADTLTRERGEPGFDVGAGRVPIPRRLANSLENGCHLHVGVRPEHLELGDGPLKATVANVEWLGHECQVACHVGPSTVTVRQGIVTAPPEIGSTLALTVDPARVHVFAGDSGERLP